MKTLYTFHIENGSGEKVTLAKVADKSSAHALLTLYKQVYSIKNHEWRCYIKERYKKAQLIDYIHNF